MSVNSPIRVTVRDSSSTDRYASFWRTSALRSGSISSRAVASRIVPSRCTLPSLSTSPRGRVNANSDFMTCPTRSSLLDLEALVAEGDALHRDLVGVGLEADARVLLGPRVDDRVRDDGRAHVVEHRDRAVLTGVLELPVDDHLAPVPERLVLVDAALEPDVAPLGVAHRLDHVGLAVRHRPLDLGDLALGVEARGLLEEPGGLSAADLQGEPNWDVCFLIVSRHPGRSFRLELDYSLTAEPSPPLNWLRRKITNSAGFTGAIPISQMTWPASITSGGLVSESHLT